MSGIGPSLPPHLLAKRKREQEEEDGDASTADSGAQPLVASPSDGEKRRKVIGPAMPPAPLDERPVEEPDSPPDSGSSDDDFGPALPSQQANDTHGHDLNNSGEDESTRAQDTVASDTKLRRDDWMMMPPKQDDLAARMDPTKQRARGFNTGKSATAAGGHEDDSSIWHETPEQKKQRLADEMMGIAKPSGIGTQRPAKRSDDSTRDATEREIKSRTEKSRGPSLLDQHQHNKGKEAEDDDPSKRAFDREKDMGSGMRVGQSQRREMLNKAANYSSKFSGGSYL